MIFYFSGTGNSKYCAQVLAERLDDISINLCSVDFNSLNIDYSKGVGFVFPVYAWGVPPIVLEFIKRLPEKLVSELKENDVKVWMVATCGDDTGETDKMMASALDKRGLCLSGVWSVTAPNIYVLLPGFDVDSDEVRINKIKALDERLSHIVALIKKGEWATDIHRGSMSWLKTAVVYPLFTKWGMAYKKWHVTDACTGCGLCAQACPVNNIIMKDGRPVWGKDCLSCVSCYHECPHHAIEYGSATKGKGQYLRRMRPIFSRK